MPAEDIQSWSPTAATNATADTGINWAEGQPRASVNNSARSMMAAHAKERNLQNGSITTGGSANAQIFISGVGYTVVPTGLWVRLKVGFTNTGPATLNMDSIGAVAIKDQFGLDIGAGALTTGQYVELLYNGTNWILLQQSVASSAPQCGRLTYVSATQLKFSPYNGDLLRINGVNYQIPSAGIAGLSTTGVFVGGVAAQNLVTGVLYLIYAFLNSGVVTADFRVFSANQHSPSATAGNVGTEIRTGDDTRTLIGMALMSPSAAQFLDATNTRYVLSWFNRRELILVGPTTAGIVTASLTAVELSVLARCSFCTWGDEGIQGHLTGVMMNNTVGAITSPIIMLNNATSLIPQSPQAQCPVANYQQSIGGSGVVTAAEGNHFISPAGYVNGGAGTFYVYCNMTVKG